jgi:hypothetical protein
MKYVHMFSRMAAILTKQPRRGDDAMLQDGGDSETMALGPRLLASNWQPP